MALPWKQQIRPIIRPSVLTGQRNGALDPWLLDGGLPFSSSPLLKVAARSFRAMHAAALTAGVEFKTTGRYRTGDRQVSLFLERYRHESTSRGAYLKSVGHPSKFWNGLVYVWTGEGWLAQQQHPSGRWYQEPGTAVAATPYTSNHGWGLADDLASENDGDPAAEPIDARTIAWLEEHAWDYGWAWELASEPWHMRHCTGDAVTQAVLAYEDSLNPPPPLPPPEFPLPDYIPLEDDMPLYFRFAGGVYALKDSGGWRPVDGVELYKLARRNLDSVPELNQAELDALHQKNPAG